MSPSEETILSNDPPALDNSLRMKRNIFDSLATQSTGPPYADPLRGVTKSPGKVKLDFRTTKYKIDSIMIDIRLDPVFSRAFL